MFSVRPKQASQTKASDVPLFAPRPPGGWQVELEGIPQALDPNGELFNARGVVEAWTFTSHQEASAARDRSARSQHHYLNHYRIVNKVH